MDREISGVGFSYTQKSQYHESCQPKKPAYVATQKAPLTDAELKRADAVSLDKVWKQSVDNEQKGLKKWESMWSYLTEYDSRGNPIEKKTLPDSYVQFKPDGPVPLTNARHYGSRINTSPGRTMLNLEFELSKGHKKTKLDSEMICY